MYEIYRRAYDSLLEDWYKETRHLEKKRKEGKPALITAARVEQLDKQMDEVNSILLQMMEG